MNAKNGKAEIFIYHLKYIREYIENLKYRGFKTNKNLMSNMLNT